MQLYNFRDEEAPSPSFDDCLRCPVFDPDAPFFWLIVAFLLLTATFDLSHIFRAMTDALKAKLSREEKAPHLLAEHLYPGRCMPGDLDFTMSMMDYVFLRECAFARYVFFTKTHLLDAARAVDATLVNNGSNIRYRKPVIIFQTFMVHTKIICWDKISFYLEQKIIRTLDDFVVAINYTRQTVIGSSPQEMVEFLHPSLVSPHPPPEIQSWIETAKISSRSLKMAGYR